MRRLLEWYRRRDCGVNDALGGNIFVCHRPLVPTGNGSYCAVHGGWPHNGSRLSLTWPEWFKAWFWRRPVNLARELRSRWRLRSFPEAD